MPKFEVHPKRAEFDQRVIGGEDPKTVGAELGIHKSTLRLWTQRLANNDAPGDESEEAEVSAPHTGRSNTQEKIRTTAAGAKRGAKVITEATAQKLCEGVFLIAAVMERDPRCKPIWLLTDAEKKILGEPLADSLAAIPAPLAAVVNTYAAPTVFVTSLVGVITAKQRQVNEIKGGPRRPPPPPPRSDNGATVQPPPPPQHEAQNVENDMELAAAVAASKGGLQAEDEPDEAERHFTSV